MNNYVVRSYDRLNIDVDMVLRGQGIDPVVARQRKPRLVALAEQVLEDGMQLIEPVAIYTVLAVQNRSHELFTLANGARLRGALLAEYLGCAEEIVLLVCTLGDRLEHRVTELLKDDPAYAFALDGFGSAAAEALGLAICTELEAHAQASGLNTSIPISPGMIGWSVAEGQPQIFNALDAAQIGVSLNDSAQMIPHKSVSMVLGFSHHSFSSGRPCDFCRLKETCRYQNRDAHYAGQASSGS